MATSVVARPMPGGRVNPSHPQGMLNYRSSDILYVVNAAREMWVLSSPVQLGGWWPGAQARVYTHRLGNLHVVTVRGVVEGTSHTTSGDVPNVPMSHWRYVRRQR